MKKTVLLILFLCLVSISMNIFVLHSGKNFAIRNFKPKVKLPYTSYVETLPATTFTYLGHGKQSMVFESLDHKYVIKLFYWKKPLHKRWYRHPNNWLRLSSPSWIYKLAIKKTELKKVLKCYFLASNQLHEETGIISLHLRKKSRLPCTLIDRNGKTHHLDLKKTPFVLQKKAILTKEWLDQKIALGDLQAALLGIQELEKMLKSRIEKGFIDTRQVFKKNYGFIDDRPVQIDIGKIEKRDNINLEKELEKVHQSLNKFLLKHYPSLTP